MTDIELLFEILRENNIKIEWFDKSYPLLGCTYEDIIALREDLDNNRYLLKCILTEELGHYLKGSAIYKLSIILEIKNKKSFLNIEYKRAEYRAKKWATTFLMPKSEIEKAIRKGVIEVWELAEYFDVPEEWVVFRLKLPDVQDLRRLLR